jgi:hypothetical protein
MSKSADRRTVAQGCQMVYFQTKNSNFGILYQALEWKILVHFGTFLALGITYKDHLVYLMAFWYILCLVWYIFSIFGLPYRTLEKSGNPDTAPEMHGANF